MGIADFFRPKYRHSDVRIRTEAVKAMTSDDAAILITVARNDRDISVRRLAIDKIDEAEVLADIAAQEPERSLRDHAGERAARLWMKMACSSDAERAGAALGGMIKLGDQFALVEVVVRAETPAVKKRAFGELRDPRALAELAKRDAAPDLRLAAVARIDDGDVLRALAIDTTSKEVGLAAVDKLEDVDRLENVTNKAKNKAVRQRARKLLAEIQEVERVKKPGLPDDVKRRRAEKAQLVRAVEGVVETFDFVKATDVVKASEAAWQQLGDVADEGDDRFTSAVARFYKRRTAYNEQSRSADELRVIEREAKEAKAAAARERAAAAAPKPAPEPEPETEEQRAARDAEIAARLREAEARNLERERLRVEDEARRAAQAEERLVRQKEDAERAVAIAASLVAMCDEMEKVASEDAKDTRAIDRVLNQAGKGFDQIGKAPPDQRDALAERYRAARAKLVSKAGELREAEDWQRWSNVPKAEALIAMTKEMTEAPATPDLGNRLRGLQALWKEVGPMPQRRSKELWDQFKAGCDQVYEKVRGERAVAAEKFGDVAKAKEALIAAAEALATPTEGALPDGYWTATADKLKALQQEWKTSGHLPRKQGDELWKRFRAACDKFFERRKPLLDARSAEEGENLAKKHALIARANAVADAAPGDGGWGKAITDVKNLQQQWKEIGYVPRRDADAIYRAFRAACDRLFAKRDEARDSEANAHRAGLDAVKTEIAAVIAGGDAVVERALAVRTKAADYSQLVGDVEAMIRHVVTHHADAVLGTALDPTALRARREKLIARAEELLPKQPVAADKTPDIAQQLKQAMQKNAFGDLRFSGRDPVEVVDELRASWAEAGPFFDDADDAQTDRFEATIARVLEASGAPAREDRGEPQQARRRRRERPGADSVPASIPSSVSEAVTTPTHSAIPHATHDAITAPAVYPSKPEAIEPVRARTPSTAPPIEEIDTGWDLGDEDPTAAPVETEAVETTSLRTAVETPATEPDLATAAEAVAGPASEAPVPPTEGQTTPSSSEMAGDGAVEGDGIDSGWD